MRKRRSRVHRVLHILMMLCVAGILCSSAVLLADSREYAAGDSVYQQLRLIGEPAEQTAESLQTGGEQAEIPEKYADGIDFAPLESINPDVVGWVFTKGTEMDYPVVQGKDNDHYLGRLFTGERNKLGSIFLDYRNNSDFSDKNTVIYGHNMKDGSMFSSLTKYKDQSYYDEFPATLLYTPDGDITVEWFAGGTVDGDYESIRFDFKDDRDFESYVQSLRSKSTFVSDTAVTAEDRIVTLCTCSYEFDNARYALYGKQVR